MMGTRYRRNRTYREWPLPISGRGNTKHDRDNGMGYMKSLVTDLGTRDADIFLRDAKRDFTRISLWPDTFHMMRFVERYPAVVEEIADDVAWMGGWEVENLLCNMTMRMDNNDMRTMDWLELDYVINHISMIDFGYDPNEVSPFL